jgi:hypothetical protein
MMTDLSAEEQARLSAALRPGEQPLWLGKGGAATAAPAGFLARLLGRKPALQTEVTLYAITPKRVLALLPQGGEQEWFLMLGLVQTVNTRPDGSGDIVFDFEDAGGQRVPRGIIGIHAAAQVAQLLADAIDAAYNASPWSV